MKKLLVIFMVAIALVLVGCTDIAGLQSSLDALNDKVSNLENGSSGNNDINDEELIGFYVEAELADGTDLIADGYADQLFSAPGLTEGLKAIFPGWNGQDPGYMRNYDVHPELVDELLAIAEKSPLIDIIDEDGNRIGKVGYYIEVVSVEAGPDDDPNNVDGGAGLAIYFDEPEYFDAIAIDYSSAFGTTNGLVDFDDIETNIAIEFVHPIYEDYYRSVYDDDELIDYVADIVALFIPEGLQRKYVVEESVLLADLAKNWKKNDYSVSSAPIEIMHLDVDNDGTTDTYTLVIEVDATAPALTYETVPAFEGVIDFETVPVFSGSTSYGWVAGDTVDVPFTGSTEENPDSSISLNLDMRNSGNDIRTSNVTIVTDVENGTVTYMEVLEAIAARTYTLSRGGWANSLAIPASLTTSVGYKYDSDAFEHSDSFPDGPFTHIDAGESVTFNGWLIFNVDTNEVSPDKFNPYAFDNQGKLTKEVPFNITIKNTDSMQASVTTKTVKADTSSIAGIEGFTSIDFKDVIKEVTLHADTSKTLTGQKAAIEAAILKAFEDIDNAKDENGASIFAAVNAGDITGYTVISNKKASIQVTLTLNSGLYQFPTKEDQPADERTITIFLNAASNQYFNRN